MANWKGCSKAKWLKMASFGAKLESAKNILKKTLKTTLELFYAKTELKKKTNDSRK